MDMKFYKSTWFIVLMLIFLFPVGLFLMWWHQKFTIARRVLITVFFLLFWGWAFSLEEPAISAEQCEQGVAEVKQQLASLQTEYDDLKLVVKDYKTEIASLTKKLEDADKVTAQEVKEAEAKMQKKHEAELKKAIANAEKQAEKEVAAAQAEAKKQIAAAAASVETEQNTVVATESEPVVAAEPSGDVSSVDANGNGKVTIQEAKDAGFSMPIRSSHWLYPYMQDNDGDGMVGE